MANVKKKLKIIGMHCTSCAMSIDGDIEDYVDGVKSAQTNYAAEVCEVEYDEVKVKIDKIIDQIKETGYQAHVINE